MAYKNALFFCGVLVNSFHEGDILKWLAHFVPSATPTNTIIDQYAVFSHRYHTTNAVSSSSYRWANGRVLVLLINSLGPAYTLVKSDLVRLQL